MPPEPAEHAVYRGSRNEAAEPAIGVCRQWVRVHDQRAGGATLPAPDHRRAGPGRRSLDVIRLPGVERRVDRRLVVEIAVAPIDGEQRRRDRHQHRPRAALDDLVTFPGNDQDHLMAKTLGGTELGLRIGADAATGGRVEGGDVSNTHRQVRECPCY